jgi:two-component system response regulator YesN
MIRNGIKVAIPWGKIGIQTVFTAASGAEALELLRSNSIHIMITDINMPEMTGLELIAKAREIREELRIIVLSGYDNFEYVRQSLRMHVIDYLLKPIDETLLQKLIYSQVCVLRARHCSADNTFPVLVEQTVLKLLHNQEVSESQIADLLYLYPDSLSSRLQVVVLIPPFSGKEDEQTDNLSLSSIRDVCVRVVDVQGEGISVLDMDRMVVLVLFLERLQSPVLKKMEYLLDELKKGALAFTQVLYGSEVSGYRDLAISKRDALFYQNQKKERILQELVVRRSRISREQYMDVMQKIKQTISKNIVDQAMVLDAFQMFLDTIEVFNVAEEQVLLNCYEIVNLAYYAYYIATLHEISEGRICRLLKLISQGTKEQALEICFSSLLGLYTDTLEQTEEIVEKAKCYIVQHLSDDLCVSSLAERFKVTPNYFSRLFKQVTKEGCNNYIVRKRMEAAKGLLRNTNFPCGRIATMVGYHDINYFSLAFKKQTGSSPTSFRHASRDDSFLKVSP